MRAIWPSEPCHEADCTKVSQLRELAACPAVCSLSTPPTRLQCKAWSTGRSACAHDRPFWLQRWPQCLWGRTEGCVHRFYSASGHCSLQCPCAAWPSCLLAAGGMLKLPCACCGVCQTPAAANGRGPACRTDKDAWKRLMLRAMRRNFTWDAAAQQYEQIFTWAKIDLPHCG